MARTALITGVTGQDGAYLAELLLAKGYVVHGLVRPASTVNTARIDHLHRAPRQAVEARLVLYHGDLTDATSLMRVLAACRPDEIYNLGAQSHVQVSFDAPEQTADVDALGPVRLLEGVRLLELGRTARIYQASTSELFGDAPAPQNERTPMRPRSPYAAAKLHAFWMVATYRQAYGLHASNGVLFNHESPRRGEAFVTRKITRAAAAIAAGRQEALNLGRLDARRDWGHARDYVRGMWLMLQQDMPDDYVLATGESRSVRDWVEASFAHVGVRLGWRGADLDEVGVDARTGRVLVRIDPRCRRPTEVAELRGDAAKARRVLGWRPTVGFAELVAEMVDADVAALRREMAGESCEIAPAPRRRDLFEAGRERYPASIR